MNINSPGWLYRVLSTLLLPYWVIHAITLTIRDKNYRYLNQRLSFWKPLRETPDIWIHASSVGESQLIKPIIDDLSHSHNILVTTFTATGEMHANRLYDDKVNVRVLPIDNLFICRRLIRRYRPELLILVETEFWPEFLYQCKSAGTKVLQINSRITEKTLKAPSFLQQILKTTFQYFDHFLVRSKTDMERLQSFGIENSKLTVCGNLKFSQLFEPEQFNRLLDQPYLLFASTHDPEELEIAKLINNNDWNLLCVIVPRHPHRGSAIQKTLQSQGLTVSRKSLGETQNTDTDVILADTIGDLPAYIQHSELIVMAGSFCQAGGHNILEPAQMKKATICGPDMKDFNDEVEMLKQGEGIIQVKDWQQLETEISRLLKDRSAMDSLSQNAFNVIEKNQDIYPRYQQIIKQYL